MILICCCFVKKVGQILYKFSQREFKELDIKKNGASDINVVEQINEIFLEKQEAYQQTFTKPHHLYGTILLQ